ncbi:ABC transporter permease [Fusibacter sp. 3D3]|uniref:ABC transporter permease n=1 Tax=Fusibacter sp. 3D3 TaxID=1048380 RepID=UPI000852F5AD|nr:ABC transporter permease [Fusibacter sp. 3D3]GAU79295.1 ABC-type multidrug transport system permease component [Fusibacter sp. 3D3]
MNRIISIFRRDFKSSVREYILLYMMIGPLLLALGFSMIIPNTESASLQFALEASLDQSIVDEFNKYGSVFLFESKEEIINRVNGMDDIAGVMSEKEGSLFIILEGNETHDTKVVPQKIIREINGVNDASISYKIRDIGVKRSPISIIGSAALMITAIILGGIIIGFNIIEEKESKTIQALNVTMMNKMEFIIGKSLLGFVLPVAQVYIILWLLKIDDVNKLMILVIVLSGTLTASVLGFLIGVISDNQIAGVMNMKMIYLATAASIVGAMVIPESSQFFLYILPTYWIFVGFRDIVSNTATWHQIIINLSWILGMTFILFMLIKKRIIRGLT